MLKSAPTLISNVANAVSPLVIAICNGVSPTQILLDNKTNNNNNIKKTYRLYFEKRHQ